MCVNGGAVFVIVIAAGLVSIVVSDGSVGGSGEVVNSVVVFCTSVVVGSVVSSVVCDSVVIQLLSV